MHTTARCLAAGTTCHSTVCREPWTQRAQQYCGQQNGLLSRPQLHCKTPTLHGPLRHLLITHVKNQGCCAVPKHTAEQGAGTLGASFSPL